MLHFIKINASLHNPIIMFFFFKYYQLSEARVQEKEPYFLLSLKGSLSYEISFNSRHQFNSRCFKIFNIVLCLIKYTSCSFFQLFLLFYQIFLKYRAHTLFWWRVVHWGLFRGFFYRGGVNVTAGARTLSILWIWGNIFSEISIEFLFFFSVIGCWKWTSSAILYCSFLIFFNEVNNSLVFCNFFW